MRLLKGQLKLNGQVLGDIFHQAGLSKAQAGRVYEAYAGLISAEFEKREQQDRAGAAEAQAAIAELAKALRSLSTSR